MKSAARAGRLFFLVLLMVLGLGAAVPAYATPEALKNGKKVKVYPLKSGNVTVYADENLTEVKDSVSGKKLQVTITDVSGNAWYGTYKSDGSSKKGWFSEKTFLKNPSYDKVDALARYSIKTYVRKSGKKAVTIPAYADVDVIGKTGKWYQVIYLVKKTYYISWINSSGYSSLRPFDGAEKRVMAEGVYTMRTKSESGSSVTAAETTLSLKKTTKDKDQQFRFVFEGDDTYQIKAVQSGLALAAETDESGSLTGGVVLAETSDQAEKTQLWKLTRKGGYYYLKNIATGQYLKGGSSFTLAAKSSSGAELFRLTMYGGKNKDHWQVFSQYDPQWGKKYYGRTNTMAGSACGILSMVNALYALNGQYIDPVMLAKFAVKNHYRIEGSGTVSTVFKADGKKYGKTYGFKYAGSTTSMSKLKKHLKAGGTAIAYVPGHYMALGDYKNGKYLALDSAATAKRATSPYGCWIKPGRLQSGSLRSKAYFLFTAID